MQFKFNIFPFSDISGITWNAIHIIYTIYRYYHIQTLHIKQPMSPIHTQWEDLATKTNQGDPHIHQPDLVMRFHSKPLYQCLGLFIY